MSKHHDKDKGSKTHQAAEETPETVAAPEMAAAPPAAAPGTTAPIAPAAEVDQVDEVAALATKLGPEYAPLMSFLTSLVARQRAVEGHVQLARGEQIAIRDQVLDLHRVVSQNADSLDALANMMAPEPSSALPVEPAAPRPPAPPPARPAVAGDVGLGLGGIAGRRRDRGVRRFATPEGGIPAAPAAAVAPAMPHYNPHAAVLPAALPVAGAATRPIQPDAVLVDELRIDPHQLGPGEHEMTVGGQPLLVRVRTNSRPSAMRRQGGGRTFGRPGQR